MKKLYLALITIATLVMSACSSDNSFKIKGHLSDKSTTNLRVMYNNGSTVETIIMATNKGDFEITGNAPDDGTVIQVYTNDYRPVGRFWVNSGDELEVTLNPKSPSDVTVSGDNDIAKRWADWTRANAGVLDSRDRVKANGLIEKYIRNNPRDIVSTLLLVYSYDSSSDPSKAMGLLESIDVSARPEAIVKAYKTLASSVDAKTSSRRISAMLYRVRGDSLVTFNPRRHAYNLLVFSDENSGRSDSILASLRSARSKYAKSRVAILDLSLDADTLVWTRNINTDSANWEQGWMAGAISATPISNLAIPRLPYVILSDSTGNQLYRGTSITAATKHIKQ